MGGLLAHKMGLPLKKFIISTNDNDEVPEFLRTGIYKPIAPSKNCISSAMNVGHPSNLARIIALYGGNMDENGVVVKSPDMKTMKSDMTGISVTDEDTRKTIAYIHRKYGILLEPHGAVAWFGMNQYTGANKTLNSRNQLCVTLETAHPAKFPEELQLIVGKSPALPASLLGLEQKSESFLSFENNYQKLKDFILNN